MQFLLQSPVTRFGPRFNGPFGERLPFVGNHQVRVEIDRISKSLAAWAGAGRIVERKKDACGSGKAVRHRLHSNRSLKLSHSGFSSGVRGSKAMTASPPSR